jgi:hypothetical protein
MDGECRAELANGCEHIGRHLMIDYLKRMETALGRPPSEAEIGRVMAECAEREGETRRKRGYHWEMRPDLSNQPTEVVDERMKLARRIETMLLRGLSLRQAAKRLSITNYRAQQIRSAHLPDMGTRNGRHSNQPPGQRAPAPTNRKETNHEPLLHRARNRRPVGY